MLLFLLFLRLSEAALLVNSPWLLRNKKINKSPSATELKSSTSKETLAKPLSLKAPSSVESFNSLSSPRVYTPSEPIPIPYSKETLELMKSDISKKSNHNLYDFVDDNSSVSSDSERSSENSSVGSPIFQMSYDPLYAEMKRIKMQERENRRKLRKADKKAKNKAEALEPKKSDSPTFGYYFTKEEQKEFDLEDISKRRIERCRQKPLAMSNDDSDLNNDSDFGIQASKGACYSLSF